ncbi:MAG: hypothetical protein JSV80_10655 [Acidobacteriota bacterium]|nr:MAG: hypothetical protein JSV80_10655 [Acidobacteriota bacterium]
MGPTRTARTPGKMRAARRRLSDAAAAALLAAAALPATSQPPGESPPSPDPQTPGPIVRREPATKLLALDIISDIPARLGGELGEPDVTVEPVGEERLGAIRQQATGWMTETLAPLDDPACSFVREAFAIGSAAEIAARLSAAFPGQRALASAPGGEPVLIPEKLPVPDDEAMEWFASTGLLPAEIALSAEWARAVAARHSGPSPRDRLLRHARAARIEGVARLAALLVTLRRTGIEPRQLGVELLRADRDRASWDRAALLEAARTPLVGAFVRALLEDGMRWATYQYVRGGIPGLVAALERPAVGPEDLLRPGLRRRPLAAQAGGCRLGPRPMAALLIGTDDPAWIDTVEDAVLVAGEPQWWRGWLQLESVHAAESAAADMLAAGCRVDLREDRLDVSCAPRR